MVKAKSLIACHVLKKQQGGQRELRSQWWAFGSMLGLLAETSNNNESMAIPLIHLDDDGLLNLDESIVVADIALGISIEKSLQIDCIFCTDDE